ncbi:hypothetical protein [Luteimonas sp. e5]
MTEFLTEHQHSTLQELQQFGWSLHAISRLEHGGHHAAVRSPCGNDHAIILENGLLDDRAA